MTKEQFIKELEHIAESGSNEIRLGNLFDVVISEAIEDCQERLNDEVKTNELLTEHINKDLFTREQVQASCEATLKKAAENAKHIIVPPYTLDKSSITDPSNIDKLVALREFIEAKIDRFVYWDDENKKWFESDQKAASESQEAKIILEKFRQFITDQKDIDPEISKVIQAKLWEII